MKLYTNARLIAVEENNFAEKESGKNIQFFTCFLKDESGAVVKINSGKENYDQYEGDTGVAEIQLSERDGKWVPKVVSFYTGEKVDAPEGSIH